MDKNRTEESEQTINQMQWVGLVWIMIAHKKIMKLWEKLNSLNIY